MKVLTSCTLAIVLWHSLNAGEFWTLRNYDGEVISARPLSHSEGKVKIRRQDGKVFEVDPRIFTEPSRQKIESWMKNTPPRKKYRIDISVFRKNSLLKKYSSSGLFFEISVRNDSQETLKNISIQYRVVYESTPDLKIIEGGHPLKENLEFNRTVVIKTTKIPTSPGKIRGCLVRVIDAGGNIIVDWSDRKEMNWEKTDSIEARTRDGGVVEIRSTLGQED